MKKFYNELVYGKNGTLSGLIALSIIGTIALGCSCGKLFDLAKTNQGDNAANISRPADNTIGATGDESLPSTEVVETLVKETISQFEDAVDSGDFSVIHEKASSDFQSTYTVDEMETAFKSYTDKKSVVVPILKKVEKLDAEFSSPPNVRSEKNLNILVAAGKFPTKPFGLRFDFEYVMRDGEWKMLKLVINIP
ncbi:MAG: hypothetical protein ABIV48_04195 [Pyrinomonadaceae bacterium]